ncbi:c-type cytochrome [Cohaesibacter haloalkalitolerans]|uniref:c-type cytochrome n=1 Tax=Cohaesibacter haloalkalitolerans TaxID=1162980 RepID=UPI000E651A38|nr:cytochrome c family protein [Cohaesibacter haloalkalitolerans]
MKRLVAVASVFFLASTLGAFAEGDAAKGEKVFKKCKACHQVGEGAENKVGPLLTGVVGRTIGTVPDFKYSEGYVALGEQGVSWDEEKLMAYLLDPKDFLKGAGVESKSKMTFKLKKDDERADVIAYLKTFSAQ